MPIMPDTPDPRIPEGYSSDMTTDAIDCFVQSRSEPGGGSYARLRDNLMRHWHGSMWIALWLAGGSSAALAAEGGFSFYLPGGAGDIALAQSAEPGDLQVANTFYFQRGDVGAAVLQGNVNLGVDLDLLLDVVSAGYTFEKKVFGASYSIGAALPLGRAKLKATIDVGDLA
ncbi:MAG: hypothetical protein OEU92_21925, partial [Alphaproteobacteria bacterium]|nr:hypothetical protein [Alphaproteobacteria bacterium]